RGLRPAGAARPEYLDREGAVMANTIKESKGVNSQKDIVTKLRCPICNNLMRQNEITVEIAFRHNRTAGEPKRERVLKHAKNCGKAA
ncbi:MAG TPA: hypothetical protein VF112_09430, partial [Candidatus Dormibacteraeota bacterium]